MTNSVFDYVDYGWPQQPALPCITVQQSRRIESWHEEISRNYRKGADHTCEKKAEGGNGCGAD
jgi:hypothetical protein